ncbi:structural maintenance of chromosomes protein 6-like isoform X2 [Glandiceps talaboti]
MSKMARRMSSQDENAPPKKRVRIRESSRNSMDFDEMNADDSDNEMDQSQNPSFVTPIMTEAEVGIIERVTMKNFMCHTRLEFNFGPNVNFIVGHNGSGKSAVLTAMVVGLGGKATVTNRGSSVKQFIKNGQSNAEVAIKLRNRGTDAYKPDLYGKSIVVERKMSSDGASQYKLKSASGKLISNKREELSHILDQYNIQVDNPVAILNQDTSRNFLHSRNPHDKYKFFLKATQLEQMTQDYSTIQEQKNLMEDTVRSREEGLPDLQKEVLERELRFKDLDSLENLKKKKEQLEHMAAWAQVAEAEREVEAMAKVVRQEEARTPKFDQKVQESKAKMNKCADKCKEIQRQLSQLGDELKELKPRHLKARTNLDQEKKGFKAAQAEARKLQSQVRNTERDKQQLEEKIQEMKHLAEQDFESERRQRLEQIQQLEFKLEELKSHQATVEHQLDQYNKAVTHDKEQSYALRTREQDLKRNMDNTLRRLKNLQASRLNKVAVFGNWVPNLLRDIDKAYDQGKFRQKPIGPIGAHLRLADPQWAIGTEACLKGLLHSYCCDNYDDLKQLNDLLEKHVPRGRSMPSVITSKFTDVRYDVSGGCIQGSQYSSFLDIVRTDNPVVYNTLIDQRGVESTLLVADSREARNYLRLHAPRNCREAFTIEGDQVYAGAEQRYYSNNADRARYLSADVEEQINEIERELHSLRAEHDTVRRQNADIGNSIKANTTQKNRTQTQRMKLHDQISKVEFDINELKNVEEPTPYDVNTLEEEVNTYQEQINLYRQQIEIAESNVVELKRKYEETEEAFKSVNKEVEDLAERVEPLKEELSKANMEEATAKDHLKHYDGKRKEHDKKINDLKKGVHKKEAEVEDATSKARQICPKRIQTGRKATNIDSEITQVIRRIQTEEKTIGNAEEITRLYQDSRVRYLSIKHEIKNLKAVVKKFDEMLIERRNAYLQFRQSIALRAKWYFITMLSQRGFLGKMKFSHRDQLLDLSVQPTQGESMMAKDMKSLSGGERSFSTVCFIMALWEAMDSPFRALDEFDVFMDMVNRRISVDMMLKVAKEQKMRQFIFLTPQDMSKITANPLVRISRMHDPDRDQDVLPYGDGQDDEDA